MQETLVTTTLHTRYPCALGKFRIEESVDTQLHTSPEDLME